MPVISIDPIKVFIKAFLMDYKHHIKVVLISVIILAISSLNYFIGPYRYDVLVSPYIDAGYDYIYSMDSLTNIFIVNDTILDSPVKLEMVFREYLDRSEVPYNDLVVVTYEIYKDLTVFIISNYSKIHLTIYYSLISGRHISGVYEAQVPLAIEVRREYPRVGDIFVIEGIEYKVVGRHKYQEDILIPYSSILGDAIDLDITKSFIYVDFNGSIEDPKAIFEDFIIYLWSKDIVAPDPKISTNFYEAMEYFRDSGLDVYSRERTLKHNLELYNSSFNNPVSPFFIVVYGGLIIFVLYFMRSIDNLFNKYREYIALLYSIGGTDRYFIVIYTVIFMIYALAITPFVILLSHLYIVNGLRIDIPITYFMGLISQLYISTLASSYIIVLIFVYWGLRRRGFADILFERFLG